MPKWSKILQIYYKTGKKLKLPTRLGSSRLLLTCQMNESDPKIGLWQQSGQAHRAQKELSELDLISDSDFG